VLAEFGAKTALAAAAASQQGPAAHKRLLEGLVPRLAADMFPISPSGSMSTARSGRGGCGEAGRWKPSAERRCLPAGNSCPRADLDLVGKGSV
jgi:hypothetical protein